MRIFRLRPLALGCFLFILSMYSSYFLGNVFSITLLAASSVLLVASIGVTLIIKNERYDRALVWLLPICLCLIIASVSSLVSFSKQKRIINEYAGTTKELELTVTDINYSQYYETSSIAKVNSENGLKILLIASGDEIEIGDTIKAQVSIRELVDSSNGYNEREYYIERGIYICGEAQSYEVVSEGNSLIIAFFKQINIFLSEIVEKSVNSDTSSLVSAMLLGNRASLGDSVRRDFATLGISHILALSGIHISLIAGMFDAFLRAVRMKKGIRYALLTLLISLFICITGFSSSAMRAGIMLFVFYTLYYFAKRSDAVTSLFVSVMLICAVLPYSIFSVSLILSFLAMLGCICSSYFTKGVRALYKIRPKFLRGIVYSLISSTVVMIFTLPIVYIKFDRVSVFSPFFNLIFVPLLSILLYLSPFVLILGKIPYVCYLIKIPCEALTALTMLLTNGIAKAKFLTVPFTNPAHLIGVIIVIISLLLALILSKKELKYCLCILATGALVFVGASIYTVTSRVDVVSVTASSYRSNDTIAIESGNEIMLIESSSPTVSSSRASIALATSLGYTDIDTYVLCDYGAHIIEAVTSAANSAYITNIVLPTPQTDSEKLLFEQVNTVASENGAQLSEYDSKIEFDGVCVDFMGYYKLPRSTKRCVAFTLTAESSRYTYLGASTYECIDYFALDYIAASDAVVFGAYGPTYKTDYSYDISGVTYFTFLGNSSEYCKAEPSFDSILPPPSKIILKSASE